MQKFAIRKRISLLNRWSKVLAATGVAGCVLFSAIAFPTRVMAGTNVVLNQTVQDGVPYVQSEDASAWPTILSQAAVVMDMNTGTIIYGKNPNAEHYPASITKIMTALLALKHGHLTDTLTASQNAVSQPPDKLYMVPGEKEKLEPLLYGLLLDSANDAAVEIAEHYGGSVGHFADMMNQEAVSLGATHTHFVNPNGLPDPQHRTTAYDMSIIARAAMQYPEFRKIVDTKYYDWNGQAWHSRLSNLNSMLFYYPGAIGMKTGYTSVAHETLVVAAKRGNNTFLAVLMDTPTDAEIRHDASQLLDYAFAHYETQTVIQKGQVVGDMPGNANAEVVASQPILATVADNSPLHLSSEINYAIPQQVTAGEPVGSLHLLDSMNRIVTTIPVNATSNWDASTVDKPATGVPGILWPMILVLSVLAKIARVLLRRKFGRSASMPPSSMVTRSFVQREWR